MSSKSSAKRSSVSSRANGAKMLVTTASLTVVVGGWAAFTMRQPDNSAGKIEDGIADAEQEMLELPPLPTLVPEPSPTAAYRYVAVAPETGSLEWSPIPGVPVLTPVVDDPSTDRASDDRDSNDKKSSTRKTTEKSASKDKPSSVADTKSSK